ncbi:MAG: hypothetical protein ACC619_08895, partial [Paracoccaceae bacterium]
LPENQIPGLPRAFGETDEQRVRWIEGHLKFCRQVFANSDKFHVCLVEEDDAKDRLASFLGIDLPWWGVANANRGGKSAAAVRETKLRKSARRQAAISKRSASADIAAPGKTQPRRA